MTEDLRVQITFGLSDPDLEDEERLRFSKQVLPELRDLDEVERADRTEVMSPESGMKGFETLVGFLTADVTVPMLKDFAGWMGDRLHVLFRTPAVFSAEKMQNTDHLLAAAAEIYTQQVVRAI